MQFLIAVAQPFNLGKRGASNLGAVVKQRGYPKGGDDDDDDASVKKALKLVYPSGGDDDDDD